MAFKRWYLLVEGGLKCLEIAAFLLEFGLELGLLVGKRLGLVRKKSGRFELRSG